MPLEHEITKKEANLFLKQYQTKIVKYLENDKIIYIKYYLGELKMSNKKMTLEDLALEMRAGFKSVNERLDNLEKDVGELKIKVDNIETDVAMLKREATKRGWDLKPNNN